MADDRNRLRLYFDALEQSRLALQQSRLPPDPDQDQPQQPAEIAATGPAGLVAVYHDLPAVLIHACHSWGGFSA